MKIANLLVSVVAAPGLKDNLESLVIQNIDGGMLFVDLHFKGLLKLSKRFGLRDHVDDLAFLLRWSALPGLVRCEP